ncbi:MAG: radical SAM protein [candidate division WOR-3 bacterium]|nr:radical SAM protein [candidate division WOR-3 bacterium]
MASYREITCRAILNKSGIPGIDFALNPYTGCEHKCAYCYAVFMKRFTNHSEEWGDFVDIKINAPEVLQRQLKQLQTKSHISIGTVCDAYQPIEEKYQITRRCLEILRYFNHSVSILTKSSLVLRDLDLILKIKEIEIGFTITTLNPQIKNLFEPDSSPVSERFKAIKILSENKIPTWVFVAPILPYLTDTDEEIEGLIKSAQESGARNITFDSLNPYPRVWHNVIKIVKEKFPEKLKDYEFYYRNKTLYEKRTKDRILNTGRAFTIKIDFAF